MPRRPNHVVLPEPGRPMARTTKPLGACAERLAWLGAGSWPASRAGFPLRGVLSRQAHSSAASRALGVRGRSGLVGAGACGRDGCACRDLGLGRVLRRAALAARAASAAGRRPGKAAPAERADSMEVPGRFCLWIPKYWDRVWSVFSCCFQPLLKALSFTRIPYSAMALQIYVHSRHIQFRSRERHP